MSSRGRFKSIELATHVVRPMLEFYRDALALNIAAADASMFTVRIGDTSIRFTQTHDSEPVYHLAFNIPENKLDAALLWLTTRAELVPHYQSGVMVVDWPAWNAHSIYFKDTAGNILELIARHDLGNAAPGAFTSADLLCVSELGLVVPDPHSAIELLSGVFDLQKKSVMRDFGVVGDDHGLFIVSAPGRPWMPTNDLPAQPFPATAVIRHASDIDLHLPGTQYYIIGVVNDEK